MHIADNIRAGMTPEEARRHALIALGGVEQTKERYRERRRTRWLDELMQDVRFAARMLVRDRGFALTVVIVLALGIGANAAIFSVVDALMLRPLPFHEPRSARHDLGGRQPRRPPEEHAGSRQLLQLEGA